jgi:RNA polymerase sigma-70 factor (ECF subfamily)
VAEASNEELLERYQSGDGKAYAQFYERNETLVFNYALSRLRNVQEAEEAFQETFFRVHRHIVRYDSRRNALAWVIGIARNTVFDAMRRRRSHEPLNEELAADQRSAVDVIEAKQTLARLLAALSEDERQLIQARVLDEAPYEELAAREGLTPENARQRVSRILRKLRSAKT